MRAIIPVAALVAAAAACGSDAHSTGDNGRVTNTSNGVVALASRALHGSSRSAGIYAAAGAGHLSPVAARATPLVYVPNSRSGTISVIDPHTYQVVRTIQSGEIPQHVVPAYDFAHLWVLNNQSSTVVPIDPITGDTGKAIHVDDPYNMYFTPDGKYAIVVAERRKRLDFRNPETMELVKSVQTECKGIDHMEFTADNRYLIATCEFNGHLVKVDIDSMKVAGFLDLEPDLSRAMAMPQDIRSSPDGSVFFVADMHEDGVHVIDPVVFTQIGFIYTGVGAHGLNPSRDGTLLYVTNRGSHTIAGKPNGPGSISVIDPATKKVIANWPIPGGGSPDMGNVTADGREYWVSGRYDGEVYVFDTATGTLTHKIPVGREPHGLCVWPQPGRFSLGHTGNMR